MIVRDKPSGLQLLYLWNGSVVPRIIPQLAVVVLLSVGVTLTHGTLLDFKVTLTTVPFTLIGLALAIFLGFRNNASYERFTEGRRLWGELFVACRNIARQSVALVEPAADAADAWRARLVHRLIAFAHALRNRCRDLPPTADLQGLVRDDELRALHGTINVPAALLLRMGEDLRDCLASGRVGALGAVHIDEQFGRLAQVLAGCERIRFTPIPFSYTVLLHRTVYMYCFLLPFGLVDMVGAMTPFVVGIVAYTFFGLDAIGDEIEEPFGTAPNDLPLDAIDRAIEIEMRASLGETDLPAPHVPVKFNLT